MILNLIIKFYFPPQNFHYLLKFSLGNLQVIRQDLNIC